MSEQSPEYFHDQQKRTVYMVSPLTVVSQKSGGWFITADITVTRADNILHNGRWAFPVAEHPSDHYYARDSRSTAVGFFVSAKYPPGSRITEAEYQRIQGEYEAQARANRPPST